MKRRFHLSFQLEWLPGKELRLAISFHSMAPRHDSPVDPQPFIPFMVDLRSSGRISLHHAVPCQSKLASTALEPIDEIRPAIANRNVGKPIISMAHAGATFHSILPLALPMKRWIGKVARPLVGHQPIFSLKRLLADLPGRAGFPGLPCQSFHSMNGSIGWQSQINLRLMDATPSQEFQ